MPVFMDYTIILRLFSMILLFIRLRRLRRQLQNQNDELQELALAQNFFQSAINFLTIVLRFLLWRKAKRNRKLVYPHLILPLLPGFR